MRSRIEWARVIVAAVLSEMAVIAILMAATGVYVLVTHKGTIDDMQQFGDRAGYYLAPAASGLATFVAALWAVRKLTANLMLNTMLVGVAAVILTAGMLFGAKPEDRLMYVVSFAIRLACAYLAGLTAESRAARARAETPAAPSEQAGSPS